MNKAARVKRQKADEEFIPPLIIESAGTDEKLRRKFYPELYGDPKRE